MKKLFYVVCFVFMCSGICAQIIPEMVTVPGGTFNMGNDEGEPNQKPAHQVTVSSFKMGKYSVTVSEFAAFIAATRYKTDAEKKENSCVYRNDTIEWHWIRGVTWRDDDEGNLLNDSEWNRPVIHVSWNDAVAYCQWLSNATGDKYRLPTEAEREYAAGNGARHTKYSWGNNLPGKDDAVGNVSDETVHPVYGKWAGLRFKGYMDGYFFTSPVGCFQPNDFELFDMTGNVWEWCSDLYGEKYYSSSPVINPQGPNLGYNHVFRGGSWHSNPTHCQVTYRYSGAPDNRTPNLGFRLAMSI